MAVNMAPYPQPMGRFPQFISPYPQTLVMKEKILSASGGSFDVNTMEGYPVLRVKGNCMSLSGRKEVLDAKTGHHLFTIRQKCLAWHTTFYGEDPQTLQDIFWLKGRFSRRCTPREENDDGLEEQPRADLTGVPQSAHPRRPLHSFPSQASLRSWIYRATSLTVTPISPTPPQASPSLVSAASP